MGRKNSRGGRPQAAKRVWVEPVQRKEINRRKLARAALRLAMEDAERGGAGTRPKDSRPNGKSNGTVRP